MKRFGNTRALRFLVGGALLLFTAVALPASDFDVLDINEGELRFLTEVPADVPHLQSTHVIVSEESLKTGWLRVRQCHYHLAPVSAMQVLFREGRVRDIRILQADNIERAWVEGPSVQLANVGKDAVLCIQSENHSLQRNGADGTYAWTGGPYLRRFLDGYFPMHVKIAIDYPASALQVQSIEPAPLRLKAVTVPGHVRMDALFEGRLVITVQFSPAEPSKGGIGWH
jgi:hypothetical protein